MKSKGTSTAAFNPSLRSVSVQPPRVVNQIVFTDLNEIYSKNGQPIFLKEDSENPYESNKASEKPQLVKTVSVNSALSSRNETEPELLNKKAATQQYTPGAGREKIIKLPTKPIKHKFRMNVKGILGPFSMSKEGSLLNTGDDTSKNKDAMYDSRWGKSNSNLRDSQDLSELGIFKSNNEEQTGTKIVSGIINLADRHSSIHRFETLEIGKRSSVDKSPKISLEFMHKTHGFNMKPPISIQQDFKETLPEHNPYEHIGDANYQRAKTVNR